MNDQTSKKVGWVYVISHVEYLGKIKIGITTREISRRISELDSATGVIPGFNCEYAILVYSPADLERKIHKELSHVRVSNRREFFKINVFDAIKVVDQISTDRGFSHLDRYIDKEIFGEYETLVLHEAEILIQKIVNNNFSLSEYIYLDNIIKQISKDSHLYELATDAQSIGDELIVPISETVQIYSNKYNLQLNNVRIDKPFKADEDHNRKAQEVDEALPQSLRSRFSGSFSELFMKFECEYWGCIIDFLEKADEELSPLFEAKFKDVEEVRKNIESANNGLNVLAEQAIFRWLQQTNFDEICLSKVNILRRSLPTILRLSAP